MQKPAAQLSTLCYIRHQGRTLMLHRIRKAMDIHAGKWNGLGGKFEAGETPEDCVKREVREESGLAIERPELRGVLTFPEFKDGVDWVVFVFVATEFSGELIDSDEGELHWVDDGAISDLTLWEGDRIFLKWLDDAHRFFSGKFIYKDKELVDHSVEFY